MSSWATWKPRLKTIVVIVLAIAVSVLAVYAITQAIKLDEVPEETSASGSQGELGDAADVIPRIEFPDNNPGVMTVQIEAYARQGDECEWHTVKMLVRIDEGQSPVVVKTRQSVMSTTEEPFSSLIIGEDLTLDLQALNGEAIRWGWHYTTTDTKL